MAGRVAKTPTGTAHCCPYFFTIKLLFMKDNYHERKQNRIDYARSKAGQNSRKSSECRKQSFKIANILQGEPVKYDHHSAGHHLRTLEKMENLMRNSLDAGRKAEYYADKADSIENNKAISSDDPDAIQKLEDKLEKLKMAHELYIHTNKCLKKRDKTAFLAHPLGTERIWKILMDPKGNNGKSLAWYVLPYNRAEISRVTKRLEELKKVSSGKTTEKTLKGVQVVENVEVNRIQLVFPAKPSYAVRKTLKSKGFHWSDREFAWQRLLNDAGRSATEDFLKNYIPGS